jgi:hypothetical protein
MAFLLNNSVEDLLTLYFAGYLMEVAENSQLGGAVAMSTLSRTLKWKKGTKYQRYRIRLKQARLTALNNPLKADALNKAPRTWTKKK